MASYNAGIVTAYGAAVRGGYTGTYEQFCAQQANYAQTAAAVEQAKTDAQAAAQRAQDVADSIPEDYTELTEEVGDLEDDLSNKYVGSRGMYNTSTPPFNNANLNHTPGVLFLSSGVTQAMCSNLPKYGVAALFIVEDAIIAVGTEAWKQTIIYVDGNCYYRFLYGAPSSPVTMNWISVHEVRPYKIVDINGSGDYTSLSQACVDASTGDTLVVFPGTYDGTLKLFNKRINIIGIDKETCIVRSTNGGYAYPAMEATTGHFENLTFLSRYISGTSQEIDTNTVGAYAVHCEGANDSGFGVGKSISFDNCRLESDFFPALGCGACKDWSINLNNCEIVSNQPTTRGSYATTGGLGAIYMHDHAGQRGHAEIYIKDCIIRTTILKYSMCIYDLGESSNDVDVQFIRNTIYSAVDGFSNSTYWRGISTPFANAFTLSPLSNGNTENELNAS